MSEEAGNGCYIAARRIPFNVCDAVVFRSGHEHQICCEVLVLLVLLALKVQIPKV